jgi:hypothetical protein
MTDRPAGADLLDAARRTLLDEIVPKLEGIPRFHALMVANALQIVGRELAHGESPVDFACSPAAARTLVAAIRDGRRDAEPALYEDLLRDTLHRAFVWKPAFLDAAERQQLDLDGDGSGTAVRPTGPRTTHSPPTPNPLP